MYVSVYTAIITSTPHKLITIFHKSQQFSKIQTHAKYHYEFSHFVYRRKKKPAKFCYFAEQKREYIKLINIWIIHSFFRWIAAIKTIAVKKKKHTHRLIHSTENSMNSKKTNLNVFAIFFLSYLLYFSMVMVLQHDFKELRILIFTLFL